MTRTVPRMPWRSSWLSWLQRKQCQQTPNRLPLDKLSLTPGMDVFVLGYPRGISGGGRFPLWKRGSIASEPDVNIDNLPMMYIDTATREGMSRAPVYAQEVGFWAPGGKKFPDEGSSGNAIVS
jgi:hypothetical protein